MKFQRPVYDSVKKVYTSEIKDGFRFEIEKEGPSFTPSLDEIKEKIVNLSLELLIQSTKGWFTKPLTQEWLKPRIQSIIPTNDLDSFEGILTYICTKLIISKEVFLLEFTLTEKKESEKIHIVFEEECVKEEVSDIKNEQPITPNDNQARRKQQKSIVMFARERAAKALFKAERLTQEYIQAYGDETDWEDELDEDSE